MSADLNRTPNEWEVAVMDFDRWLASQPREVQELSLLEQIEIFALSSIEAANDR